MSAYKKKTFIAILGMLKTTNTGLNQKPTDLRKIA